MAGSLAPRPSDDANSTRGHQSVGFDRVLFHVEGWQDARAAVPCVARITRPGGQVVLLHTWNKRQSWRGGKWDAEPERDASALLTGIRSAFNELGLAACTELVAASSHELPSCLRRAATHWQADLTVIGLGRSRLRRLGWVPSTEDLTRDSHPPVLCVTATPQQPPAPGPVLLSVGTGEDGSSLSAILALSRSWSFTVHVLHVCRVVQADIACYAEPEAPAWTTVRKLVTSLQNAGIRADGCVTTSGGRVANEILAAAHQARAGLIVVGGHSPSMGRLRWGTVHELLAITDRPVLVGGSAA